jgi:hypothetical protein
MRDLAVLVIHLLATVALAGPGGARAVVAESVLVKQQLLIFKYRRLFSSTVRKKPGPKGPVGRSSRPSST